MQMGDSERISKLVADTVLMLCKNSIHFDSELKVKGIVGVISDATNVFLVDINETFGCANDGEVNQGPSEVPIKVPTRRKLEMPTMPPPRKMMALMAPPSCGASSSTMQAQGHQQQQFALVRSSPAKGPRAASQTMGSRPRMSRPVLALPTTAQVNARNFAAMQRRPMAARTQMLNSFRGRAPGAAYRGQGVRKPSGAVLTGRQIQSGSMPRQAVANRGRMRGTLRGAGARGMRQAQPVRRAVRKMNPHLAIRNVGSQIVMPSPQSVASSPMVKRGVQQSPGNPRQLMITGLQGVRNDGSGLQNQSSRMAASNLQSPRMMSQMSPGQRVQTPDSRMQIALAQPPRYSQALALTSPKMGNPPQFPSTPTSQRMEGGRGRMQLAAVTSPRYSQALALPSPQMVNPAQSPLTPTTPRMQGRGQMQQSPRFAQLALTAAPQMVNPAQQSPSTPITQRMQGRGQMQPSPRYSQLALPPPQLVNPRQQSPLSPTARQMEGHGRLQLSAMQSPRQVLALPSPQMVNPPQSPLTPTAQRTPGRGRMQLTTMQSPPRVPPACLQSTMLPFHGNRPAMLVSSTTPATSTTTVLSPTRLVVIPSHMVPLSASTSQPGTFPMSLQVAGACGSGDGDRSMSTSSKPLLTAAMLHSSVSGTSMPMVVQSPTIGSPRMKVQAKLVSTASQGIAERPPMYGSAGQTIQLIASPTRVVQVQTGNIAGGPNLPAGTLLSIGHSAGSILSSSTEGNLRTVGPTNPQMMPGATFPRMIVAQPTSGVLGQQHRGTVAVLRSPQQNLSASDLRMLSPLKRPDCAAVQNFVLPGALSLTQMTGNQLVHQTVSSLASVAQQQPASVSTSATDAQAGASRFAQFLIAPTTSSSPVVKVEADAAAADQLVAEVVSASSPATWMQQAMQSQSHGQQAQHNQMMQQVRHGQQQGSLGQQQLQLGQQQGQLGQQQGQLGQQQGQHGLQQGQHGQQLVHGQNQQQLVHVQPQGFHGQQAQQGMNQTQQLRPMGQSQLQPNRPGQQQQQQLVVRGQQQQMITLGQQQQLLMHGQPIQVSQHGQQIQVSQHGQPILVASHGQNPQLSTHGQPRPSSVMQPGQQQQQQQQLRHPTINPSPVVIRNPQTRPDGAGSMASHGQQQELRRFVTSSQGGTNLQQSSSANQNPSQSENPLTNTGQQTPKTQIQPQQTFPAWQAQSIQRALQLQSGTQAWQKVDSSVAQAQKNQVALQQQQQPSLVTKADQISSVQIQQPVTQNRLASPYRPVMQNQTSNQQQQQSSLKALPGYHNQQGQPSGQSTRSAAASNQGQQFQPSSSSSDQTLVPLPVAVVSAGKIFQPTQQQRPPFGQTPVVVQTVRCTAAASNNPPISTEKPKIQQQAVVSTSIPSADLNWPSSSNLSAISQAEIQQQQPASAPNFKTFIQNLVEGQPDRFPSQRESPQSQGSANDAYQSPRNRQEPPSVAGRFPAALPSYESCVSHSGGLKKRNDRETFFRCHDDDQGSQQSRIMDEFDLDAFAFAQVQKLVELKQMEIEKSSVEVASSTSSSGKMTVVERAVKSGRMARENAGAAALLSSQLNLEEPDDEVPLPSLASMLNLSSNQNTTVVTGCITTTTTTTADGSGDGEGLVESPVSPSETIAYSEGGSPLRLEESDLENLGQNLMNYAEPLLLFGNKKLLSNFRCRCIGCRFTINNEMDLASHYANVHTGDISLEPADADSRYLPLLESSGVSDDPSRQTSQISCPFPGCVRAFSKTAGVYNHHLKAHKVGLTKRQKRALSSKYGLIYHCPVCLRDFLSKSDLQHHMSKTRHGK